MSDPFFDPFLASSSAVISPIMFLCAGTQIKEMFPARSSRLISSLHKFHQKITKQDREDFCLKNTTSFRQLKGKLNIGCWRENPRFNSRFHLELIAENRLLSPFNSAYLARLPWHNSQKPVCGCKKRKGRRNLPQNATMS